MQPPPGTAAIINHGDIDTAKLGTAEKSWKSVAHSRGPKVFEIELGKNWERSKWEKAYFKVLLRSGRG